MRVLWTHNFDPGNPVSGVFMRTAADALADRGVDIELEYLGNLRNPRDVFAARRRVRRMAASFDVVHSQFGSACALVTTAIRGRPLVVSLRGSDWTPALSSSAGQRVHAGLASRMTRRALPRYRRVVVMSNRMADEVRARFPGLSVSVQPDPIDLHRFVPRRRDVSARGWGGPRRILFTAARRDDANKRLWLAEQAVAYARESVPGVELVVASGVDPIQMPELVASADVALLCSDSEGWPNCIKEALACNVPFVATDVSDLAAIAAQEPSCHVVDATPQALGTALVDALRQSRETPDLRRRVNGLALDRYADSIHEIYESAAALTRE